MKLFKNIISKCRSLIDLIDSDRIFRSGEIRILASSLSYTTLISFIPFMAVVLSVFHYVGGLDLLYPAIEKLIFEYFKEATSGQVVGFLRSSLKKIHSGSLGTASVAILLFASYRLLSDADRAINRIWQTENRRPLSKRLLAYWLLMFLAPLILALYAGFSSIGNLFELTYKLDAGLIHALLWFWGLTIFYIVVPDLKVKNKIAVFCAGLSAIAITVIQQGLAMGILKFIRYNKVYGSLAAVPVVLIWIFAVWYVILFGAYINYRLQKRAENRA